MTSRRDDSRPTGSAAPGEAGSPSEPAAATGPASAASGPGKPASGEPATGERAADGASAGGVSPAGVPVGEVSTAGVSTAGVSPAGPAKAALGANLLPDTPRSLLGVLFAFSAFLFAGAAGLTLFAPEPAGPEDPAAFGAFLEAQMWVQAFASLVAIAFFLVWPRPFGWRSDRPVARVAVAYPLFLLAWVPISFVIYPLLLEAWSVDLTEQDALGYFALADEHRTWLGFVVTLASVCVLGPVAEEVLFRGFMQSFFRRWLSAWPAILITATLFGLVHGWIYALPTGLLGVLFGWLAERSGGLAAPALAHVVHNSLTVGLRVSLPWLFERTFA